MDILLDKIKSEQNAIYASNVVGISKIQTGVQSTIVDFASLPLFAQVATSIPSLTILVGLNGDDTCNSASMCVFDAAIDAPRSWECSKTPQCIGESIGATCESAKIWSN